MGTFKELLTFMLRFSKKVRFARLLIVTAMAGGLAAGVATVGLIALVNRALNDGATTAQLFWPFLGLCVALPTFRFISDVSLIGIAERSQYDLRRFLIRRVLAAPLRQIEQLGGARILANLTEDVGVLIGAMALLPTWIMHLAIVLGCLVYMAALSWPIFGIALALIVLGVLGYQVPMSIAEKFFRRQREAWDVMFEQFKGLTSGIKELKIHRDRRRAFVEEKFEPAANERMRQRIRGQVMFSGARAWGQSILFVLFGVLLFGAEGWLGALDNEALTGSILALLYIMTPLEVLLSSLPQMAQASAAIRKAKELEGALGEEEEEEVGKQAQPPRPTWQRIDLENVTYTYLHADKDEEFVLGPVNLTLHPGEIVFLVGGNGSGKTTLAKLLIGLYSPEAGHIRIDGEIVADGRMESYRQLFSVVFSDFYLFEDLLGLASSRLDEQARSYLEMLHLEKKVRINGGKLSTIDLSQGQRTRLALLTAYLEDRPIYLFDEWAADQDPVFKEIFYRTLLPDLKARGKTVLAISHDDRYYSLGDRLVKLVDGQIDSISQLS